MDKKTRNYLIAIAILLFVAGFGLGYLTCSLLRGSSVNEQYAYEALADNHNLADYDAFLDDYPDSPHFVEVKQRRERLEEMLGEWNQLLQIGTIGDYLNFKSNYDDKFYNRLCDLKIDSLEWCIAMRLDTREAYDRYLRKYPDGTYASEASVAIELLDRKAAEKAAQALAADTLAEE